MTNYITRNANILLLFLILLSAGSLVGATIYFQTQFGAINAEYNSKLTQLQNVSTQLEEYQGILAKAREELQLKGSRETELTTKFTDVKSQAETLQQTVDRVTDEKARLQVSLSQSTSDLNTARNTISERDVAILGLKDDNADLLGDITVLDNKVDDLQDEVSCLKSTADASEGSC